MTSRGAQPSATQPRHAPLTAIPSRKFELLSHTPPPSRKITVPNDVTLWLSSEAFVRIYGFVTAIGHAVAGCRISTAEKKYLDMAATAHPAIAIITRLLAAIETIDGIVTLHPAEPQGERYGSIHFRDFIGTLQKESPGIVSQIVPPECVPSHIEHERLVAELSIYLTESFGSGGRIDYGTGHELAFISFLVGIAVVGMFDDKGSSPTARVNDEVLQLSLEIRRMIGLVVFERYLRLVRRIQRTYRLEPAGSHGVWGLDDFQFIPYLWGSAQMSGTNEDCLVTPSEAIDPSFAARHASENLYLQAIKEIHETKKGPFFEHSSVLYSIAAISPWAKIHSGLVKMYIAEVLSKFPIVQHLYFGELLPLRPYDNMMSN